MKKISGSIFVFLLLLSSTTKCSEISYGDCIKYAVTLPPAVLLLGSLCCDRVGEYLREREKRKKIGKDDSFEQQEKILQQERGNLQFLSRYTNVCPVLPSGASGLVLWNEGFTQQIRDWN